MYYYFVIFVILIVKCMLHEYIVRHDERLWFGSDVFNTFFSCFMFAEMNKYWFIVLQWCVVQVVESRFWRTQVKMIIELDSAEIV